MIYWLSEYCRRSRSRTACDPHDMALVGYVDIDFARSTVVRLSSVRQPREAIGVTAIDLVSAAAKNGPDHQPEHVVFQPELIRRDSTSG
jgi:LacI family transcriptional regulator